MLAVLLSAACSGFCLGRSPSAQASPYAARHCHLFFFDCGLLVFSSTPWALVFCLLGLVCTAHPTGTGRSPTALRVFLPSSPLSVLACPSLLPNPCPFLPFPLLRFLSRVTGFQALALGLRVFRPLAFPCSLTFFPLFFLIFSLCFSFRRLLVFRPCGVTVFRPP